MTRHIHITHLAGSKGRLEFCCAECAEAGSSPEQPDEVLDWEEYRERYPKSEPERCDHCGERIIEPVRVATGSCPACGSLIAEELAARMYGCARCGVVWGV